MHAAFQNQHRYLVVQQNAKYGGHHADNVDSRHGIP